MADGSPKATTPPTAEKASAPKQDEPKGIDDPTSSKEDKPQPGKTDQQVAIPRHGRKSRPRRKGGGFHRRP